MKRMIGPVALGILPLFIALAQRPAVDTRALVDRTQNDLRRGAEFERHKGKEVERYENAQHKLSEFDKDYSQGHWDKGKLDDAIDAVKNVVEHNTLDPEARDALRGDLQDLRAMRSAH